MTTTEKNRKLIEEYCAALSKDKSGATIDKYVADDHLKGHIIIFETGLPNYQLVVKDMIVEGNKVAVRANVEGVHKGDLFGVPPSGKKVNVEVMLIYEIRDNKIVNHWMQSDSVALMQQIGAMPVAEEK